MCSVKEKNSPTSSKNVNFVVESKIEMTVCDCKEKIVSLDCSKIYLGQGCKKKSDFTSFLRVTLHSQNVFSPSKTSHGVEVIM